MKKILLALAIIASLFVFSGCDAILEGLFPDQTGGGGEGNNTIEITVLIPKDINDWWNAEVVIELREMNDQPINDAIRRVWPWDPDWENPDAPAIATARYDWLPDGEYKISAWLDFNYDGWANEDEPFGYVQTEYGDVFPMPFPNPEDWEETWNWMSFEFTLGVGGEIPILIKGPQVINYLAKDLFYSYDLIIPDGSAFAEQFDWRLEWAENGDNWGSQGGGIQNWSMNFFNAPWIGLNYLIVADNIDLNIGGEVTGPYYTDMEVRIVEEPLTAEEYHLVVDSWGFDGPPFFLPWENVYDVKLEITNGFGTLRGSADFPGALVNGGFNLTTDGLIGPFSYRRTDNGSNNGVDRVIVHIDANQNGFFYDNNDLTAEGQIGVDIFDPTDGGGNFYANVGLPPFRYLKTVDFFTYW
jgi:hypothetical protein